jgi:hypothetical protein
VHEVLDDDAALAEGRGVLLALASIFGGELFGLALTLVWALAAFVIRRLKDTEPPSERPRGAAARRDTIGGVP